MQFNPSERKIAYLLDRYPYLKFIAKKIYQYFNFLIYKKQYFHKTKFPITRFSWRQKESFFGYYDKSPLNKTNEYLIFHSSNISTKQSPNPKIPVNIILYDVKNNRFEVIDKSYSYNWQQGSRLMWIDDYKFIYNNFENGKYISKIYDIKTKSFTVIDFPIYDCFRHKFAISLNFERLNINRSDYSYRNMNLEIDWKNNKNDGLYFVDLNNNTSRLILSLQDVIDFNYKDSMKNAKHKFNHIMISPDGEKIMFIHRWFSKNRRKFDTLLVCNIDGSGLKVIADNGMVSHCYWYDDENIFGYLREFAGDRFYMINIKTLKKEIIGKGIIDKFGDGHPTIYKDKVIFDTYPNKARMKELYLFNMRTQELTKLGEFFESFDFYGETRCDLHPRFSYDGKYVFFDSVHEGKRYLYMMDLGEVLGNGE